ncbi:VOC family protein [Radicibacter daui]|uniref:VOC family protein n=1 Tax=Radicibacter daui TaxID=3064829 RepID=UPI004046F28D
MLIDHATIRTADLEGTRRFLEEVLGLTVGPRPDFGFPGYWLYADGQPLFHLIPGRGGPVDRQGETLDHVGLRLDGRDKWADRLSALGIPWSPMELPELGERRLFIRTPGGILLELVFRDPPAGEHTAAGSL